MPKPPSSIAQLAGSGTAVNAPSRTCLKSLTPAPSVDFSQQMVIAAVMPLRPSSGYRIAIESVTEFADHIEAEVVERSPAPGCVTLTVITRPFDDQPGREVYMLPPRPEQVVRQTFCGT